jgi:hypothetical protein
MIRKLLLAVIMLGVATTAVAERTVYKWVDSRGQLHYTDRPPSLNEGKVLSVYQESTGLEESGQPAASPPPPPPPEPGAAGDNAVQNAVQADVAKVRAAQCKEASDRYKRYVEARWLTRQAADGKVVRLSDKEATEARVQAKKDMDEACK